ncbi:MAG: hypothetical protein P4L44_13295 [Oryzomonas sp.]|uniref:hypothetical protein n=1 Tax=Oryzomonas sp. TaxID=2855186 RepID=UPI002843A258|nr:hypothetical protein [Oryzomonas sp.]MDR3580930.1 hypothetical protein [Oryzomonas sp.]
MLKILDNKRGIALVTTLMMTLIALTMIMTVLYTMTVSTKQSGLAKSYKTALGASYGASEIIIKDVVPQLLLNSNLTNFIPTVTGNFLASLNLQVLSSQACISAKLQQKSGAWPAVCGSAPTTLKPKEQPDFQFTVPGTGSVGYTVYSKIVDTVPGNSDMSGVNLLGEGVAESTNSITPPHYPYVYRMEIQAERASNPSENARLSVVYGY